MGSKASRNTSIEALRLVAVAGIAMFHTFQWTFQAVCTGLPEYAPLAAFPYSGVLGFINLLGCWANEVFFMISGYFLVPSAVRALQNGSSAQDLTLKSLERLKKIILPTLFYCGACLLVSMYVYPLPEISLHEIGWLTLGIEFIWVYAATVCMAPLFGLTKNQLSKKSYTIAVVAVGVLVFIINGYLAAQSSVNSGEFSWLQKIMSAVTYVIAFLMGGLLRDYTGTTKPRKARIVAKRSLAAVLIIAIALEAALSATGNLSTMTTLSYKSTSIVSFALAAASLLFAATRDNKSDHPRVENAIVTLSAATLGFYVMQSLTSSLWRPVFNTTLANILASANNPAAIYIVTGTAISIVFAPTLLIIDAARSLIVRKLKQTL